MFKGLITVHRGSEEKEQRAEINTMLKQVYQLLCEIHMKMYKTEFPFKSGTFGETNVHALQHKNTSGRADLSDDCDSGWEETKNQKVASASGVNSKK